MSTPYPAPSLSLSPHPLPPFIISRFSSPYPTFSLSPDPLPPSSALAWLVQRYSIIEAVVHLVNRDWRALTELYRRMGFIPAGTHTS